MPSAVYPDSALVVVGHGSTKNAESRVPVYKHALELRRRRCFAEVLEAFWKEDPRVGDVVAKTTARRVFIAPLFISEGYFSEQVIPGALGFSRTTSERLSRVAARGTQTLFYCHPIGTHESMTDVLLSRAREVIGRFPFPRAPELKETTVIVAGHGTTRDENSRKTIDDQVERLRSQNLFAAVHAVFLEEDPRIAECYTLAATRNMVVLPFFISDGMHTQEDIPVHLGEPARIVRQRLTAGQPPWRNPTERKGKLVWYAPAVGTEPQIADVILQRVREAAEWTS